jgi:hypothetical protein
MVRSLARRKRKAATEKQTAESNKPRYGRLNAIIDLADFAQFGLLEGEIETAAHHTEVVRRTIHYVPAEITNPANMRCDAEFDATTELTDQLCLGPSLFANEFPQIPTLNSLSAYHAGQGSEATTCFISLPE